MNKFLRILSSVALGSLLSVPGLSAQGFDPFAKEFQQNPIGPGSTSELVFTITNIDATPIDNLDFSDSLPTSPGAMTIADGAGSHNCGPGVLSAPSGGTTISFSGGQLGASSSCTVRVNVTASDPGDYTNTSSSLTFDGGSFDAATDDVTVSSDVPGFSKDFAPDPINLGETTTLTFTIDNSAFDGAVTQADFFDNLPAAITIASPSNASTTCGTPEVPATVTAPDGGSTISFSHIGNAFFPTLPAGSTCTLSVDVIANASGVHVNQSGELSVNGDQSAGIATAALTVNTPADLLITKEFTDDPVSPGGSVTLEFNITNLDRATTATDVAFTDDLDDMLSGAVASTLTGDCGGNFSGTGTLVLTGGVIAPGDTCTLSAEVTIPADAKPGSYTNTTTPVTGTTGSPVTGNAATNKLSVVQAVPPLFAKSFTNDPIDAGGIAELVYTIHNPNLTSDFTNIEFSEILADIVSDARLNSSSNTCGATITEVDIFPFLTPPFISRVDVTGGSLTAGATCTVTLQIDIPASTPDGTYPSTSGELTADSGGTTVSGGTASDTLSVNAPIAGNITLSKSFSADSVFQGSTADVTFTLQRSGEGTTTEIAFTDDLEAFYAGTTLSSLGSNTCGGTVGGLGTSTFSFSGGELQPERGICEIVVTLAMGESGPGVQTNTTSEVTANQDDSGAAVQPGTQASDDIEVLADGTAPVFLIKEFTDDPVIPGSTVTLEFTIQNPNTAAQATDIAFTDNLDAGLTGLAATGLPLSNVCGAGSSLSGTSTLTLADGILDAEGSCTFSVTLNVPADAGDDSYPNRTSSPTANVGGGTRTGAPARDDLVVSTNILDFSKSFTNAPVRAGSQAELQFQITNLSATDAVTAIAFTDNLDDMLTDATFASATGNDCGGMRAGSDPGIFQYEGGTLNPLASCTITILIDTPAAAASGNYPNTTNQINGLVGAVDVNGGVATADLELLAGDAPNFSKSFNPGTVFSGESAVLTFTIENVDPDNALSDLEFTDNLDDMQLRTIASDLPAEPCGAGSTLSGSGTGLLAFSGGTVPPGDTCTFDVTVTLPGNAVGTLTNATSDLTANGLILAGPATDSLTVETSSDISVALSDSSDPATPGQILIYTVTVDNNGPQASANVVATFTLPADVVFDSTTGCDEDSGGVPTCSLGSIASGGSAQYFVSVLVNSDATAQQTASVAVTTTTTDPDNTNDDASESTDLAPSADIRVTKSDGVTSVAAGENVVYAISVFNDGPSDAPSVTLNDTFPAVQSCTYTSAAADGATGNTAAGSGNLAETLAMPADSSVVYTATCAVAADATGTLLNTASASSTTSDPDASNNSATDNDTVIVPQADISVTKTDDATSVVAGQSTTYTITVANAGPSDDPEVDMTDAFPATLGCNYTSVAAGGATGNTSASGNIADTLSLPADASVVYTAVCDIADDATGILTNTASAKASVADPDAGNDNATDNSTIQSQADISVTKTDNRTNVTAGESLIYEIVALNSGPSSDPSVSLSDTFPAALDCTYTSTAAGGATGNTSGAGDLAETLSLPVGGSVTYLATCGVDPGATGTLTNTATASASVTDPDALNDSATDTTDIDTEADIAVTKTDNRLSVAAGTSLTYEIVASNNGPSADPSVSLSDTFPAILTCDYTSSATAGASGNSASGSGDLAETLALAPGSSVTYLATCDVPIDAAGTLSNTAAVSGSVTDPDASNDTATDDDTLIAEAVLDFTKTFDDATIVQGQTTALTFTIDNTANAVEATGLTFNDTFPDILVVDGTPGVVNGCNGAVTADPASDTVSLAGGNVLQGTLCTIQVTVKATGFGTFDNPAVVLASSFPDAELVSDSLEVTQAPGPAFSKLFDDEEIAQGETTGLTFTIDNAANGVDATDMAFTDPLPGGLVVTQSGSATNDCGGTLTAVEDATSIALSGGTVSQGGTCTIFVTVRAIGFGQQDNPAITLTSSLQDSTLTTDSLNVARAAAPGFSKLFADDEIVQGATTQLTFTIDNAANAIAADDLAFSDVFPDTLVVADAPAVDNQCNGTLSADPGSDTISLSGGSLAASDTCEITVTLKATGFGAFENPVITLTSTLPDAELVTDSITVTQAPGPVFTKEFGNASIAQGDQTTLTFTIDNAASLVDAEGMTFTDPLPGGLVVSPLPGAANACGGSFTANAGANSVGLTGGNLPAGQACVISVTLRGDAAGTDIQNVTSALTSDTLPDGDPATAMITVAPNPLDLSMLFAPDTIQQNQTALLTYTFTNNASIGATAISLTDDLPANVVIAPTGLGGNRCGGTASAPAGGTTVSLSGGFLGAGQTCEMVVNVTSAVVGTYPDTTETASSSLGDSVPATDTLNVTGATTGSITIVQNADIDDTFGFSSATPDLNFSLVTEGGTARQGPIPLDIGTYVVTQTRPNGFGNVGLFCDDADSTGDVYSGVLTIVLGSLENVTCTFVSIKSDQVTIDLINRFMTARANLILSNQPELARRLERLNRGFGDAVPVTFRNGDLAAMMPFTFNPMSVGSGNYRFSTSLSQVDRAAASIALGHGANSAFVENRRFDAWVELSYQKFNDNAANEGHFGIGYAGLDYLVSPDLLVGALLQLDTMEDSDAAANNSASGTGWMFGPYLTARLAPNLYFDARLAYGRSNNEVSPFNTYTDTFIGERWLVTAGLTGEFKNGPWTIRPHADLSYYEETQQSYVDSLNVLIPSQTVSLGQIRIGPTISGRFELDNGVISEPSLTLDGIYNFGDTSGVTVTDPTTPHTDGFRGRIKAGVNFTNEMGTRFGISGIYDGIGQSDFESLGLAFELNIPLYKAKAR